MRTHHCVNSYVGELTWLYLAFLLNLPVCLYGFHAGLPGLIPLFLEHAGGAPSRRQQPGAGGIGRGGPWGLVRDSDACMPRFGRIWRVATGAILSQILHGSCISKV